jgi:hypothetical protein
MNVKNLSCQKILVKSYKYVNGVNYKYLYANICNIWWDRHLASGGRRIKMDRLLHPVVLFTEDREK